jgi:hypothetical protein
MQQMQMQLGWPMMSTGCVMPVPPMHWQGVADDPEAKRRQAKRMQHAVRKQQWCRFSQRNCQCEGLCKSEFQTLQVCRRHLEFFESHWQFFMKFLSAPCRSWLQDGWSYKQADGLDEELRGLTCLDQSILLQMLLDHPECQEPAESWLVEQWQSPMCADWMFRDMDFRHVVQLVLSGERFSTLKPVLVQGIRDQVLDLGRNRAGYHLVIACLNASQNTEEDVQSMKALVSSEEAILKLWKSQFGTYVMTSVMDSCGEDWRRQRDVILEHIHELNAHGSKAVSELRRRCSSDEAGMIDNALRRGQYVARPQRPHR